MARLTLGSKSRGKTTCLLMLFSIGNRRLAARAEEVGGIFSPSQDAVPVPSETPFVNALIRRGGEVFPVFDLAAKLQVRVRGEEPLCLIVKHRAGPMAVRIDTEMPTLHAVEQTSITPASGTDPETLGSCVVGTEEVQIYSLANLESRPNETEKHDGTK